MTQKPLSLGEKQTSAGGGPLPQREIAAEKGRARIRKEEKPVLTYTVCLEDSPQGKKKAINKAVPKEPSSSRSTLFCVRRTHRCRELGGQKGGRGGVREEKSEAPEKNAAGTKECPPTHCDKSKFQFFSKKRSRAGGVLQRGGREENES